MLGKTADLSPQLALQASELDRLRTQASQAPEKAVRGAAQQFEALFLNTLLRSMRDAGSGEGLFDSEQTKLYTSMLDQQFAQTLSKRGIGLADMMVKQLSQQMGAAAPVEDALPAASNALPAPALTRQEVHGRVGGLNIPASNVAAAPPAPQSARQYGMTTPSEKAAPASAQEFAARLAPHARQVAAELGVPEKFLVGHAALESGWGKREPRLPDGSASHNLFGIKADRNWSGAVVEVTTTEYVNGRREVVRDKFRAYSSYEESLRDYADFLRTNPRYAQVLTGEHNATSFARSLQSAGYATDPRYAEKLAGVINGRTLRGVFA